MCLAYLWGNWYHPGLWVLWAQAVPQVPLIANHYDLQGTVHKQLCLFVLYSTFLTPSLAILLRPSLIGWLACNQTQLHLTNPML